MTRKALITIPVLAVMLASCRQEAALTEIRLNLTEVTLSEGQSVTLSAAVTPSSSVFGWKSLDPSVARVQDGLVTAVSSGETYVLASAGGVNAGCLVTVIASVSGISLDKSVLYMKTGQTETLTATVSPANALNPAVSWTSSDPAVARVVSGRVTAVGNGEAVISARTEDGGYTESCTVYVMTMPVSISIEPSQAEIILGSSLRLDVVFEGADESTLRHVLWSSSDESVASVDGDGTVSALAGGNAVITARTVVNGLTATAGISVTVPLQGISLPESVTVSTGGRVELECVFTPSDAANKNVSWSSDNEKVAIVTENGVVWAMSQGTARITAVAQDGGHKAVCTVTVVAGTAPVSGITLDKYSLRLLTGRYYDLVATVAPADAADKTVRWSSDDEEIAAVDAFGRVTAGAKAGETLVTATTADGGFTARCAVTVVNFDSGLPGYEDGDYEWKD